MLEVQLPPVLEVQLANQPAARTQNAAQSLLVPAPRGLRRSGIAPPPRTMLTQPMPPPPPRLLRTVAPSTPSARHTLAMLATQHKILLSMLEVQLPPVLEVQLANQPAARTQNAAQSL